MSARKYLNIKDLTTKEFEVIKQIGFKSVAGGVIQFNNTKVELTQLDNVKKNIHILSSWLFVKNSQKINMDHCNKYQVVVWIKLIKRTNKVSLKDLIGVFTAMVRMQNDTTYRNKYAKLFSERLAKIENLSEDWKERLMRTVANV